METHELNTFDFPLSAVIEGNADNGFELTVDNARQQLKGRDIRLFERLKIRWQGAVSSVRTLPRRYLGDDGKIHSDSGRSLYKSEWPAFFSHLAGLDIMELHRDRALLNSGDDALLYEIHMAAGDVSLTCDDEGVVKRLTLRERAEELSVFLPAVFLAATHRQTPAAAKFICAMAVAYALSPLDLVPDFIPVIGYIDDIILVPALIALALRLIPDEVMEECREKARDLWNNGKPRKWYYAVPAVLIWLIVLMVIIGIIANR